MEFRTATKDDLGYMADHSISRGVLKRMPDKVEYVYTLEHDDKILCVGGFILANLTTAWCWIDISSEAGGPILTMHRVIRDWIEKFCEDHKIIRSQAHVDCSFTEGITLVQHLGFMKESIMEKFMGDKDAFLYKRIF